MRKKGEINEEKKKNGDEDEKKKKIQRGQGNG